MPDISFNGLNSTYEVIRCTRKTLGVVVSPNGTVTVRAPYGASNARIADFAERLKPWVFKHLARYRQVGSPRGFVTGESLPYLGKKFKLTVIENDTETTPVLKGNRLSVFVTHGLGEETRREAVKQALSSWYKTQARQVLTMRLDELAIRMEMRPTAVRVKHQTRRWGSCTERGVINLNWQLVMAPPEVVDYVIVHELCHLKVHGHQREFWDCVARYAPDYKKPRKWLFVNGHALSFLAE